MLKKVTSFINLILIPSLLMWQTPAWSLPQDANVISGDVNFEQVNETTLNITASAGSIIEYASFNIGAGETVNFFLPSTDSFSLNRVTGGMSSDIMGNLFANGNLILVNSFGFNIGSAANIDAGGLILSTRDITNQNFLDGNFTFGAPGEGPFSSIRNDGVITSTDGKYAVLIASSIENNGTITAPLGTVALASGDTVTVGISQDGKVAVAIEEPVSGQVLDSEGNVVADQIKSTGVIQADGGKVILTAQQTGEIFTQALNLEGHVRATTVTSHNGVIEIKAGGASKLGAEVEAGDLHISGGGDFELEADIRLSGSFALEDGVLHGGGSSVTLGGNWDARGGTFDAQDSHVIFNDSSKTSTIYGDNTFNDLSILTPEKIMNFEAGKTQNITGDWTVRGSYAQHVRLLSTEEGEHWQVNSSGARDLTYTWVEDSVNLGAEEIIMTESTNRGNSIGWDPIGTWTNGGGNGLWSNVLNWSGLGGATPGAGDDLVFDGTNTTNSFVDPIFLNPIGSLTVSPGYGGVITLQANLTITTSSGRTGDLTLNSGTLDISNRTLTIHGNMTHTTGTLNTPGGTVDFAGTGSQSFTHASTSYYNLTHSGSGTVLLAGASPTLTVTNNFTNSAGLIVLAGHNLDFSGATFSNNGIMQAVGSETFTGVTQDTDSGTWRYAGDGDGNGDSYTIDNKFSGNYYNLALSATDSSETFINNGGAITINGAMTVSNGTYSIGASGTTTVTGLTTVSGGTYNNSAGSTQTFGAGLTISGGTFTGGAGTVDVNGVLTLSAGTLTAPSGNLQVSDDFTISGAPTFTHNSGTLIFDSATKNQAFTTNGVTLNNLTMNNTHLPGILTISGTLDVNGGLTLTSGNLNLATNDPNVNVAGDMSIADGALLNVTGYTGTFTFDGSGTLTDSSATKLDLGAITIGNSSTRTLGADSKMTSLSIGSNSTFSLAGNNFSFSSAAAVSNDGTFRLRGTETLTNINNLDINSGTVHYTGASSSVTVIDFGTTDYFNLTSGNVAISTALSSGLSVAGTFGLSGGTFHANGQTGTYTGLATLSGGTYNAGSAAQTFNGGLTISGGTYNADTGGTDINGNLTLSSGTLSASVSNFTVSGNWNKSGGTLSEGTGTITFDGSGTQTLNTGGVTSTDNFYNLTHSGSGTLRLTTNDLVVSNNLTNSGGTFDLNGQSWTMTGATFSNTATVQLRGDESITGLTQDTDSGTWRYVGDGDSNADVFTVRDFGTTDYNNLEILATDSADVMRPLSAKTIAGTLNVLSGTYESYLFGTTVQGATTISGGIFSAGTQTDTFANLTISGGVFTGSSSATDVNGSLTISSGTFTASSSDTYIAQDLTQSGGTFAHNNGNVTFDGTGTSVLNVNSAVTFYDLSIASTSGKTVQFTGGDSFTVANANTFSIGNNATLESTNASQWDLNVANSGGSSTGITFGTNVTISDANNVSTNAIDAAGVTNGGNNTRINFSGGSGGGSSGSGGGQSAGGGADGGFNTGAGGGSPTGSSGNREGSHSGGQSSNGGVSNNGGTSSSSGGHNRGSNSGDGGSGGPSGNFDTYFEGSSRRSRTKVTVLEGAVIVVERDGKKGGKTRILGQNDSAGVGAPSGRDDFSGEFYANFRNADKFKTTLKGGCYGVYLNEFGEYAIIFVSEKTGPVALQAGKKPVFVNRELPNEMKRGPV